MSEITRKRTAVVILLTLAVAGSALAQVSGQSFEVTPDVQHATVGDSVSIRFRVRLDERDLLFDTIPQPISAIPPGVRLLAVEKMSRTPDRIFHGRARLVFYRPGRRAVPVFGLPFMRAVKGVQRATLASDSAFVEIVPLLPAGNPSLKDIQEVDISSGTNPVFLVAGAAAALALLAFYRYRRRRPVPLAAPAPGPVPSPAAPYSDALERLERIARANWPAQGLVEQHYESIVDVLRKYLEASEGIPAGERTTEELLWSLPPFLSQNGQRETLRDLLEEADLVKFALFRPAAAAAGLFLDGSRDLLRQWHETTASSEYAVR
ncbi:MAG: hypothetical protein ACJ8BF_09840 [Gemmatimonadales bacterium]